MNKLKVIYIDKLLWTLFIIWGSFGYSANIFVASIGSDGNSGSILSPYKTITYAASVASPGDIVYVRGGTYTNTSFGNGSIWNDESAVRIVANGTAANYITFMPYNNENVIIQTDGTYGILVKNSSYVKIIGFEVKGMSETITQSEAWYNWGIYKNPNDNSIHNLATELGIDPSNPLLINQTIAKSAFTFNEIRPAYYNGRGIVANSSHHIELINNKVHHCPQSGIRVEGCDYVTVSGNEVYSNTYYTSAGVGAITVSSSLNIDTYNGVKIIIEKNKVYNNENRMVSWNGQKDFINFQIDEGSGIFFTRNNDDALPLSQQYQYGYFLVRNNLSYKNGAGGVTIHKTYRAIIENNTLYKNGNDNTGNPGGIGINTVDDVIIRNNIIYAKSDKFALGIVALPANNVRVGYNILYNENGSEPITNKINSTYITNYTANNGGWQTANPLFANVSGSNFHLLNNSPGVNYGTNATSATDDLDGYGRDLQPDAGAYEYNPLLSVKNYRNESVAIFPNPVRDILNFIGEYNKNMKIYSIEGIDFTASTENLSNKNESLKLNVSKLRPGVYILKIGQGSYKFLKN